MICSAIVSLTCSATGIGWYGDPVQQGWETPRVHSRTFSVSALSDRCSNGASLASTALPSSVVVCESCIMFTETVIEVWLVTSACPVSSVIMPRTAGTTIDLVWFTAASDLYCVVSSTCRYHSRPPRTTSRARAITYSPSSRLRERGGTGPPPRTAAAAGGACATGDVRAAATHSTATRCTSCPARYGYAGTSGRGRPRPS